MGLIYNYADAKIHYFWLILFLRYTKLVFHTILTFPDEGARQNEYFYAENEGDIMD
jgi:hypothetical protein